MRLRFKQRALIGVCGVGIVLLGAVVSVRMGGKRSSIAIIGDEASFAYVTIWNEKGLDAETLAHYQRLANTLAALRGVPVDRWHYYSGCNDGVNWIIKDWGASITLVEPTGDGDSNVTIVVGPHFVTTPYGTSALFPFAYSEKYRIDPKGKATYLGSWDADGSAGQTPGEYVIM